MSLLIISASLNPDSNSRLLAREAERVLREDGQAVTFLDLRDLPLPLCDGDKAYADPNVLRLDKLMAETDGVILATPIYNYDGNAAAKNLIELTGDAWENKVVAFLCSAGGMSSYMSIMGLANSLMLDFRCVIVPRFVYATGKAFSGDKITDSEVAARVAECARATAKLAAAMK
ncbi:MAG TPA: NADPH-dependent FMN reductase [Opitutaceae bacterium]|nr:NADPH-dependent FMN reductase [Opitutaceae bacterium]